MVWYQIDVYVKCLINLGNYEVVTIILQRSAYIESNNIILIKVNQPLSETLSHIFFNKINFTIDV